VSGSRVVQIVSDPVIDYYALAMRSLDEPLQGEDRDAIRVWADYLQNAGDPTGMLIALEHGIVDQPSRRRELEREIKLHLAAHGRPLLGKLWPIVANAKRELELEWRSGMVRAVFVDLRYGPHILEPLIASQLPRLLRRLEVRVRRIASVDDVSGMLAKARLPAIEELVVMPGVRPTRINMPPYHVRGRHLRVERLAETFDTLRLLVVDDSIVPLRMDRPPAALSGAVPSDRVQRKLLGRSLTSANPTLRVAAIARVKALGPAAAVYVDTLLLLLAPRIEADTPVPQDKVIDALAAIGLHARRALPQLATITGRPDHYDEATRKAAGRAIEALRR